MRKVYLLKIRTIQRNIRTCRSYYRSRSIRRIRRRRVLRVVRRRRPITRVIRRRTVRRRAFREYNRKIRMYRRRLANAPANKRLVYIRYII
jgi:hypothetical protein